MTDKFIILCVDDNADTRRMLTFILAKAGYDVITAEDGLQAIEKAKAWRPALILMDMMMPRMTGAEAVRELRKLKVTKGIPILMLSAYAEQALVDEALEAGANDYILKTVLPDNLTEIIDKYLAIGSAVLTQRPAPEQTKDEGGRRKDDG
ncbi:MAG: response regulator [Chloroflexi bacterium]|nr:MAG: response regulator [Chloroflexota bacterium]